MQMALVWQSDWYYEPTTVDDCNAVKKLN